MAGSRIGFGSLLLAAALLLAPPGAGAAEEPDRGPAIGAALPHALEAEDQDGTSRNFRTLRGKKGLILMFSRSFDW